MTGSLHRLARAVKHRLDLRGVLDALLLRSRPWPVLVAVGAEGLRVLEHHLASAAAVERSHVARVVGAYHDDPAVRIEAADRAAEAVAHEHSGFFGTHGAKGYTVRIYSTRGTDDDLLQELPTLLPRGPKDARREPAEVGGSARASGWISTEVYDWIDDQVRRSRESGLAHHRLFVRGRSPNRLVVGSNSTSGVRGAPRQPSDYIRK